MSSSIFSEEIISRLTFHISTANAIDDGLYKRESHAGQFKKLPNEVIFRILDSLDMQSISRFSRTSCRVLTILRGYLPFQELIKHASPMLIALRDGKMIASYAASVMFRQILRPDRCLSCERFGVYAFLPTCERVCYEVSIFAFHILCSNMTVN